MYIGSKTPLEKNWTLCKGREGKRILMTTVMLK